MQTVKLKSNTNLLDTINQITLSVAKAKALAAVAVTSEFTEYHTKIAQDYIAVIFDILNDVEENCINSKLHIEYQQDQLYPAEKAG